MEIINGLVSSPATPTLLAVVGAILYSAFKLYRTQTAGRLKGATDAIAVLPWDTIKYAFQQVRHSKFTVGHEPPYVQTNSTIDEIEDILVDNHFGPWNTLSFNYKGEDLNMRRIECVKKENGEKLWLQTHVRVFSTPDGAKVKAHRELCPIEHPGMHIEEVEFSEALGMKTVRDILQEEGVTAKPSEGR